VERGARAFVVGGRLCLALTTQHRNFTSQLIFRRLSFFRSSAQSANGIAEMLMER